MKYFKKVEGKRIYLSPMNIEDAEKYVKWLNDSEITKYLGEGNVIDLESEKQWIKDNKNEYQFAIVLKNNDQLIGNCGLDSINWKDREATVGIFIGDKENQNKGYGKEALKCLLSYAFNVLNLNSIMLTVYSYNERAIKTYKSLGFKVIGNRREAKYYNGKYYDIIYMDILKREFNELEDFIYLP